MYSNIRNFRQGANFTGTQFTQMSTNLKRAQAVITEQS